MTALEGLWRFLLHLLKPENARNSFVTRFLAGTFGSAILHAALLFAYISDSGWPSAALFTFILYYIVLLSGLIGLVVAADEGKGSLALHFLYGVLLPGAAYLLAGFLWGLYR